MSRATAAWAALAAVFVLAALVARALPSETIDWQNARAAAEPWRAWTAVAVHYSALHLAANVAGALLAGALGVTARIGWSGVIAWLIAWPLTQFALLLRPELGHYGGLSGVLHAGTGIAAVHLVLADREPRRRWIGAAILAVLAAKVIGEAPWGPVLRAGDGWDIAVVPFAHASGLLAGVAAALALQLVSMRRS